MIRILMNFQINVSIFPYNSQLRCLTTKSYLPIVMNVALGRKSTDNLIEGTSFIHLKYLVNLLCTDCALD